MYNKKRDISLLFLFILIFSNVGLSFNIHLCQGEIERMSLHYANNNAHECEMTAAKLMSCCSDDASSQADDDCCTNDIITQSPVDKAFVKSFPVSFEALLPSYTWTALEDRTVIAQEKQSVILDSYCESNAPPLFKLYCQYLFYA